MAILTIKGEALWASLLASSRSETMDAADVHNLIFNQEIPIQKRLVKGDYYSYSGGEQINHLIYPIWEYYINNHTTLSCKVITPHSIPLQNKDIENVDIVLCNAKYYNMLIKTCDVVWCRVFFDEADSINIPACTQPRARFVWFISSSLQNMLFPNGYFWKLKENKLIRCVTTGVPKYGYIRNTCKHLETSIGNDILPLIIVKLNDDYIDSFMNLHQYDKKNISCEEPYYLRILHDEIPVNIEDYLNGSDMDTALEKLGCPIDTKENLISYFCRQFESQKSNLLL